MIETQKVIVVRDLIEEELHCLDIAKLEEQRDHLIHLIDELEPDDPEEEPEDLKKRDLLEALATVGSALEDLLGSIDWLEPTLQDLNSALDGLSS